MRDLGPSVPVLDGTCPQCPWQWCGEVPLASREHSSCRAAVWMWRMALEGRTGFRPAVLPLGRGLGRKWWVLALVVLVEALRRDGPGWVHSSAFRCPASPAPCPSRGSVGKLPGWGPHPNSCCLFLQEWAPPTTSSSLRPPTELTF